MSGVPQRKRILSEHDEYLIRALKAERAELMMEQQRIRRELKELTDAKLSEKFECGKTTIQSVA